MKAKRYTAVLLVLLMLISMVSICSAEVLMPERGSRVKKNGSLTVDYSNCSEGYVIVRAKPSKSRLKVRFECGGKDIHYDLNGEGEYEVFPLSFGNGTYTIGLFRQVSHSDYEKTGSVRLKVSMPDPYRAFLYPNQWINYTPETPAVIAFTSGTTGQSKMVRLTHKNICSNIMGLDDHFKERLSPGMSVLPLIPFFHMYGLTAGVLIPLYYGMTVNYLDSLKYASAAMKMMNPDVLAIVPVILESIARRIIAAASGNPALIPPVIKKMFSKKTRLIICGGASLCDDIYKMFSTAGIEVCTGYGMTECSPVLACNPPGAPRIGSVGTALISDFEEIKIVDNEIMVRGEFVMDAYYEDEEETEKIFRDGWLATGDLGYFDEDGYLYITGRKKNLIILSDGNNIAPEELENKIGTNPLVGSVMVHTDPDDRYNRLIASIYPDWEYINEHSIPDFKDKVKNAVLRINSELPPYKRISKTKFVRKDFEKNRLGKIKRFAVSGKLDK